MKLSRVLLVCTVLFLAVTPTFAEPTCSECLDPSTCINAPGQASRCKFTFGVCDTVFTSNCIGRSGTPVLADWKIASIEISRPGQKVVTAPAAVAQAATPQPLPAAK